MRASTPRPSRTEASQFPRARPRPVDHTRGATAQLGTALSLKVNRVKITFDATKAKNVGKFEDVVSGDLVVSFRIKDTGEIIVGGRGGDDDVIA